MYKKSRGTFINGANSNYSPDVTVLFFSYSLNDFLMNTGDTNDKESSSDEGGHDLATLPLIEKANAGTDMDSDVSDDMNYAKALTRFNM